MTEIFSAIQIIAEQRIREAQDRGEFENLPGAGKPLELEDLSAVPPELRMAWKILKNAGCVPEEVSNRKEIATLTDLLANCADEQEQSRAIQRLRYLLERANIGSERLRSLECNEEYYQKALARLSRFD